MDDNTNQYLNNVDIKTFNNTDGLKYEFNNIPMEFWKPITELSVPGVLPIYIVSDLGRIYDCESQIFIKQYDDRNRHYLNVYLKTVNGSRKIKSVHRIVLIEFCGFDPDPERDEADHISGIKYNNSIYNLRWLTGSENITAAYDLGLMPSGEDSPLSKLSNEDVRVVCQMMQYGSPREEIYAFLMDRGIQSPGSVLHAIYTRRSWSRVSEPYTFANYNERFPVFTDEQIHIVCQCLEKNMAHDDILRVLGFIPENLSRNEKDNFYTKISHIKRGHTDFAVSSQYDIDRDFSKNTFTPEEAHIICRMLEQKAGTKQILYELGYGDFLDYKKTPKEYFHYMNALSNLIQGRCYSDISSQYDLSKRYFEFEKQ